ncbi:DUF4307 domain-containing protein [Herbiconiux sp.]|uniref:DUF4307 domain-containing protein n=1 Tax=Herbiconiux sp. TaxID=1871186 RepID=UPI0025BBE204|nr:DUF4307 domain-containing protein [Herbiconiux sp.]
MSTDHLLEERYGRTPSRRRRTRLVAWVAGSAVAVVVIAWVLWAGLDGTNATVATQDIAHTVIDDSHVEVRFDVTLPRGEGALCAVQALSDKFAVVGWKVIEVPPSDLANRSFTEVVRTSELATTGLISNCWLP